MKVEVIYRKSYFPAFKYMGETWQMRGPRTNHIYLFKPKQDFAYDNHPILSRDKWIEQYPINGVPLSMITQIVDFVKSHTFMLIDPMCQGLDEDGDKAINLTKYMTVE